MSAVASNLASLFTVPPAVVTGVVPVAKGWMLVLALVALPPVLAFGAVANTNAEGGSPPTVAASAAFNA